MMEDALDRPASTLRRLGWLALLWAGGVAGLDRCGDFVGKHFIALQLQFAAPVVTASSRPVS